ncbi:MAG: zinc ribbon domain-containing protein [Undibacterium sp.]|nr:zinc ribbon domain-containing protein [Undibacterium sp.]MDO9194036.1 zinc ribbon domain-containing protein [Undibacterium sp.]
MPIYAYRCEECGFAKDVLQKMSDEPLTVCLECGKPSFKKQVTAAGFQLKGSGWYVTDFRDGKGGSGASAVAAPAAESASSEAAAAPAAAGTSTAAPASTPASTSTSADTKAA